MQGIYIFVKIIVLLNRNMAYSQRELSFAQWYSNEIYNSELLINVFN